MLPLFLLAALLLCVAGVCGTLVAKLQNLKGSRAHRIADAEIDAWLTRQGDGSLAGLVFSCAVLSTGPGRHACRCSAAQPCVRVLFYLQSFPILLSLAH